MAERKIRAGYYRRYDGKVVYVVSLATDADTGVESVIWTTYPNEYAKDLCEHYNFDRSKYRLCVKEKRFVAITKSNFAKLKEDLQFLDNALKTVLATYQDYFRERFMDGLSIRKYAEAHQLNRGSVDYQQKKFFSALASLLKERDEAEGTCRLLKPAQK